jgi:tRNA A-37 threonylcarbamoyl transferase component Bud32
MTKATAFTGGDLEPGSLVNDRYRVIGVVGRGGLATVYRAEDESLGRTVALKVISGSLGDASDARRHEDEVRLIAGFDHPGLVTLFDFVPLDGGPAAMLVMQFVDGTNLASRIAQSPLTSELTADIGVDVAAALAHIHARGVIHRDVKPANILLPTAQDGPTALLADFGIARLVDEAGITSTGTIVGTASYLSPEQAKGESLGPPTDVYSLGLVLLESLTGTRAFPGNAVESVAARLSSDPEIPVELDAAWKTLLTAMLARKPSARPTSLDIERQLREIAGPSATGPTLVLPAAQTAATERLVPATATERLVAAAPAPTRAPRAPIPIARTLVIVGGVLVALLIITLLLQWRPSDPGETVAPPSATPSVTEVAEIVYPQVPGKLGDALAELQQSVGSLGSESAAEELQASVLEITQRAANGEYDSARDALESLGDQINDAELTSGERDAVQHASDTVRAELDRLIRDSDGPGNSDKPGKKH